ncbi:MAG: KGK domain-containing protein [Microcoleaceae cyanobacterium]
MEEREKIDLSNYDDSVLRIDNEAFIVIELNDKIDNFLYNNRDTFFNHIKGYLYINLDDKYREVGTFYKEWCKEGVECQLLKPGEKWQKGKVRFSMKIEFFPDEAEEETVEENGHQEVEKINNSPLDEIRQQLIDESNS